MTPAPSRAVDTPDRRDWKRCLQELETHAQALESTYAALAELKGGLKTGSDMVEIGFGSFRRERKCAARSVTEAPTLASWAMPDSDIATDGRKLSPYPGHGNASILTKGHAVIGFFIAKSDEANIEAIVSSVFLAQRERQDFAPLFVTESSNFRPFLMRGYIFEYLPAVDDTFDDRESAEAWKKARLDLIQAKWGISHFVNDVDRISSGQVFADGKPRVVVFPDYGLGNPYIEMMYRKLRETWNVSFDTADGAANAAELGPVVFHLHWEDAVYRGERRDAIPARMASFIAAIDRLKRAGGRFIWTVHNLKPHDAVDEALHAEFVNQLVQRADMLHANSQWVAERLREDHGMAISVRVIDHPSYAACYPKVASRMEAAIALGLEVDDTLPTFLFFGNIRRYKGVERLLNAAAEFDGRARFVIAGRSGRYDPCESMPANCSRIEGFADEETLSRLFSIADFVVLPFERLTTSGSLLLAQSFARPVIAPRMAAIGDLVSDGREGFLYDQSVQNGLADAIGRALDTPHWQRQAMGRAAEATAGFRAPEAFSDAICQMYEEVSGFGVSEPDREPDRDDLTVIHLPRRLG